MKTSSGFLFLICLFFAQGCEKNKSEQGIQNTVGTNDAGNHLKSGGEMKGMCLFLTQTSSFTDANWNQVANSHANNFVIVPQIASTYGSTESGYKTQLAPLVINVINKLIAKNSAVQIWIGTPGIDSGNCGIESTSLDPFYNYITYVQAQIGTTKWSNNIKGVYMNEEAVYGTVNYSDLMANATIKLMNDLSYRVRTTSSKKFLWIPYYGYGADAATTIKNIGYVADQSTIFDYAIIQPHYYFDSTVQANLNGVYYSVTDNKVDYRDGVAVITTKGSSTIIGVEMEFDWQIVNPNNYAQYVGYYNEYVTKYTSLLGSHAFSFYWGGNVQYAVSDRINAFY